MFFEFIGASGTIFFGGNRFFGHNSSNSSNIEYFNIENSSMENKIISGNYNLANCLRLLTIKLPEVIEISGKPRIL